MFEPNAAAGRRALEIPEEGAEASSLAQGPVGTPGQSCSMARCCAEEPSPGLGQGAAAVLTPQLAPGQPRRLCPPRGSSGGQRGFEERSELRASGWCCWRNWACSSCSSGYPDATPLYRTDPLFRFLFGLVVVFIYFSFLSVSQFLLEFVS